MAVRWLWGPQDLRAGLWCSTPSSYSSYSAQVVNGPEDIARLKTYVKRVYDHKMDQLVLDLDGDGEVSMDEFLKVLMRDNFWNDQAEVDETHLHLHGGAVATKQ